MKHGCCCDCFVCKTGKFLGLVSECRHGKCKMESKKGAVKKKTTKKAKRK